MTLFQQIADNICPRSKAVRGEDGYACGNCGRGLGPHLTRFCPHCGCSLDASGLPVDDIEALSPEEYCEQVLSMSEEYVRDYTTPQDRLDIKENDLRMRRKMEPVSFHR